MREDLIGALGNPAERRAIEQGRLPETPLHEIEHPLLRSIRSAYEGGPERTEREKIVNAAGGPFWKAKSGQWRGAVWVDTTDDSVWLCAAGLRRAGDHDDFYKKFERDTNDGDPASFLPAVNDRARLKLEIASALLTEWERNTHIATIELVAEAVTTAKKASREISPLSNDALALGRLTIEVLRTGAWTELDGAATPAEVGIQFAIDDWGNPAILQRAQFIVCCAIEPDHRAWDVAPDALGVDHLLVTISEDRLRQLLAAAELTRKPNNDGLHLEQMTLGTHAHYADKHAIAFGAIEGRAIRAVCGQWFVPHRDPTDLPICDECETHYAHNFPGPTT